MRPIPWRRRRRRWRWWRRRWWSNTHIYLRLFLCLFNDAVSLNSLHNVYNLKVSLHLYEHTEGNHENSGRSLFEQSFETGAWICGISNHCSRPLVIILSAQAKTTPANYVTKSDSEMQQDVRFSLRWRYSRILWYSGLLRRVVWWLDTNVSEDHVASIFRFYLYDFLQSLALTCADGQTY